jgi:hypothetical protein
MIYTIGRKTKTNRIVEYDSATMKWRVDGKDWHDFNFTIDNIDYADGIEDVDTSRIDVVLFTTNLIPNNSVIVSIFQNAYGISAKIVSSLSGYYDALTIRMTKKNFSKFMVAFGSYIADDCYNGIIEDFTTEELTVDEVCGN